MPFDGNKWNTKKFVPYSAMLDMIRERYGDEFYKVGDSANDTTKSWKVNGYAGKVGFITSMSQNFCGTCNRVRLTADGNLKACLFGPSEVSLRDAMREGTFHFFFVLVLFCFYFLLALLACFGDASCFFRDAVVLLSLFFFSSFLFSFLSFRPLLSLLSLTLAPRLYTPCFLIKGKSDAELLEIVSTAVKRKQPRHSGMFDIAKTKNRPMITIGG